jgi:hypothetical protein
MGIKYEPTITKLTDEELRQRVEALEDRHGMSSAEFLKRYNGGELEPERDYIHWAGLLAIAARVGVKIRVRA